MNDIDYAAPIVKAIEDCPMLGPEDFERIAAQFRESFEYNVTFTQFDELEFEDDE